MADGSILTAVTIIPCCELSVGSWRRIATPPSYPVMGALPTHKPSHDLVAYMSSYKRTLNWFIHSHGYGFKMEIPFEIIAHTEYSDLAPNAHTHVPQSMTSFHLNRPPNFYLETSVPAGPGRMGMPGGYPPVAGYGSSLPSAGGMTNVWKRCADWTEGMQASSVLRHDLIASSPQIMHHVLRIIRGELASPHSAGPFSSMSSGASSPHSQGPPGGPIGGGGPPPGPNHTPLQLLTPPYSSSSGPSSADPSGRLPPPLPLSLPHVQPPPMASLGTPPGTPSLSGGGYGGYDNPPSHHEHNRPRSYTAPGGTTGPSLHDPTYSSHHSSPYSAHPSYGTHQSPPPEPPLHHPSHLSQYSSNRQSYGGDYASASNGYGQSNGLDYGASSAGNGLPPQRSSSAHTPTPPNRRSPPSPPYPQETY
jgi:hypothetical protein